MTRALRPLFVLVALAMLPTAARAQYGLAPLPARGQSALPPQEEYHLRLEYRDYRPDLTGKLRQGTPESEGSLLDLNDDLLYEDAATFEAAGVIQFRPGIKIRGSYTKVDLIAPTHAAPRTFTFAGARFERSIPIASSMKGGYYAGGLEYDLVKNERGIVGVVAGARYLDADVVVAAPDEARQFLTQVREFLPAGGVVGRVYTGRLSVEGELHGLPSGNKGKNFDYLIWVRVHVSDRIAAGGGYRKVMFERKDTDFEVRYETSGWQFGVELSL